ncbi:MAG: hypothetical protein AC479_07110 [miscellaneous Crenarchaeota group-6 archaeon AD8-1]|nr:MAG: hypothetical protein AC479_07110 [miscellaneous Crenarchaeota group-6 archaeon AD8-1]
MVQKIEFNKKIESYCCSNPNCKTNFSHPKILKYYICPKCQSLVEMEGVTSQPVIEEISSDEEFFPGDFQSIKDKLTKEIEELNIKIKNNLKEIKELKIKNCNLNKKFGDMENKLHSTKHQLSLANSKLGLKYKELSQISKSIQDTKKITELESELKKLKTEKETLNLKTQKIEELEKKLSENDIYAKNLDQSLDELKEQIKKLKEQKEKALKQKNEAIEKQAKTENQINQEIETRTKLQNELVDKSIQDTKKITELESELKKLKTEKETLNLKTQRSNDIKSQSGVNWIRDINLTEVKNVKKENIEIINDANVPKNPYLRIIEKDKKEGTELKSSSGCSFYLGYLSERDKGETIPSSCIECSKSLECMLSKVHKSNKSVKEIKKWYRLK